MTTPGTHTFLAIHDGALTCALCGHLRTDPPHALKRTDEKFSESVTTTESERDAVRRYLKAIQEGEAYSARDSDIAYAILKRACDL